MKLSGFCILLFSFLLGGCLTSDLVQGPDGSWYETGRKSAYPNIELVRSKKGLKLPLPLQIQLINYRARIGVWPYSLEGFMDVSERNEGLIQSLYEQGFQDLLFLQQADTLLLYFNFSKQMKIKHSEVDEGYTKTNLIPGVWKFFPATNGKIHTKEELYVDY